MSGPKPENSREGFKNYDSEGYKLMDDFYSGRIKIGKAEPKRRRANAATNSPAADSSSQTNRTSK
jgi:hypothetical protein